MHYEWLFWFNFNSHAHVERDGRTAKMSWQTGHFNSHAHVERDLLNCPLDNFSINFNSHAHVERDGWGQRACQTCWHFNSHAHVERDPKYQRNSAIPQHFNSHAHVERDTDILVRSSHIFISTHTLTWSVTQKLLYIKQKKPFQLTRSRGAWLSNRILPQCYDWISTHTLTWSVTYIALYGKSHKYISTHTLTWSVTLLSPRFSPELSFQLTRSRGAWPQTGIIGTIFDNFNSHAHVERDLASPL